MTARELLRYVAYRIDCDGQPCGGGETCAKKPTCTDVANMARLLANRIDEERLLLEEAYTTRGKDIDGVRWEVLFEILARLDAPLK